MPNTIALRTSSPTRPVVRTVGRVKPTADQALRAPAARAVVRVTPRVPAARPSAPSLLADLNRALLAVVEKVEAWTERRAQRRALRGLSDQMLQDIGRSRSEAEAEASKPFWMV